MSFGRLFEWNDHIQTAVEVMERSGNATEAAEELTDRLQHDVTKKSLLSAMARAYRNGQIDQPAKAILGSRRGEPEAAAPTGKPKSAAKDAAALVPETQESQHNDPELMRVVRAVQRGIVTWHDLADHLDLSPSRTKELVQAATEAVSPENLEAYSRESREALGFLDDSTVVTAGNLDKLAQSGAADLARLVGAAGGLLDKKLVVEIRATGPTAAQMDRLVRSSINRLNRRGISIR
ncbi:hypothetical protein LCGC14_1838750 [marine sediment metagenome]|uniref:Uncharacterized protein n=1 Tax=marine sediment metagenome TaxID=412755 RepID=A0A0F9GDX7_9ZZZZ